jgi:hypothetical protein
MKEVEMRQGRSEQRPPAALVVIAQLRDQIPLDVFDMKRIAA